MRMIRFEFTCSRPVPLYAHLCNQYLQLGTLDIKIGFHDLTYFIEAEGDLKSLGDLADKIAQDFLISVWLIDPKISLVDKPFGGNKPLTNAAVEQEFCQKCVPQFGDSHASHFGDIALHCDCCQGHTRLEADHIGLSGSDISGLVDSLIAHGTVQLPGQPSLRLSLTSELGTDRQQLLISDPHSINAQFHLQEHDVFALSSIEKPWIMARPIHDHPTLTDPLYNLRFAHNRLLVVLCEKLRSKGVDWVYCDTKERVQPLVRLKSEWSQIKTPLHVGEQLVILENTPEPLHDIACVNDITAKWQGAEITCSKAQDSTQSSTITSQDAATCALHAGMIEHKQSKSCAVIYFSQHSGCQIQSIDNKKDVELFFALPQLPRTGYDIYYHLEQSSQKQAIEKFKHKYPQDYLRLLDIDFSGPTDNLQTLWAIAAVLLGLPALSMTKNALSDALISASMAHRGANSPRIDYPLTKGEAHRGLNWCKTLGALISFRLADDRDSHKLAFGMHDSLADFIANWIEHLDQNIGIKSVVLAGSELANPVLSQRLTLRLSNNFPLKINRRLDIDGNNLAVGGLYLKKRRKLSLEGGKNLVLEGAQ